MTDEHDLELVELVVPKGFLELVEGTVQLEDESDAVANQVAVVVAEILEELKDLLRVQVT